MFVDVHTLLFIWLAPQDHLNGLDNGCAFTVDIKGLLHINNKIRRATDLMSQTEAVAHW